ncbi:hypothetical protein M9458_006208, partial [Cirrhinus mrigala]
MSLPSVGVTLRTPRQMGLSFSVGQSRGSLRWQREPSIRYTVARGTLPSGVAEPQLPSEAARVPPPILSNLLTYSAFNGTLLPGAAEPKLPSVTVRVPPPLVPNLFGLSSIGPGSPFRCSRAAAHFGNSESPSFDICHHAPPLATCRARHSRRAVHGLCPPFKFLLSMHILGAFKLLLGEFSGTARQNMLTVYSTRLD